VSDTTFETRLKIVGSIVAVSGLLLAGTQFIRNQSMEAAKPYLERKLKWCEEAVEAAAFIATADPAAAETKVPRFRQLFWGVMNLVESKAVFDAMGAFENRLREEPDRSKLKSESRALAQACRAEMAATWSSIWSR
jgi:hypothetical protein